MQRRLAAGMSVLTRPRWKVGVLGGGVTGCALAARLSCHPFLAPSNGRGLLLIDRQDVLSCDFTAKSPRVFTLTETSREFLELPASGPGLVELRGMQVWRAGDPYFLDLPFTKPGCVAKQNSILGHLQHRLTAVGAQTRAAEEVRVMSLELDRPCVLALDGEEHEFDLVVSAEGGNSALARQLRLPEQILRQHQRGLVCRLRCAPHSSLAFQKFFREEVLGLLPQEEGHLSLVWSVGEAYHDRLTAMSEEDFLAELGAKLDGDAMRQPGFVPPPRLLGLAGPRLSFPLNTRWLASPVSRGLVFVGDSAHTIHPMLGQGLNIGLAECAGLARTIEQALARGEGLRGVGAIYAHGAAWRFHALKAFVEFLKGAYYPHSPALRAAVGLGVAAVNRLPGLREAALACAN